MRPTSVDWVRLAGLVWKKLPKLALAKHKAQTISPNLQRDCKFGGRVL